MLTLAAVAFLAAVAVCQGGGGRFSQLSADPWSGPFSFPADPWPSVTADNAENANRLEGWQREKLDEYQERLEDQEQSEGLYTAQGFEDPAWLSQQDLVGLPVGLRDQQPFFNFRDAADFQGPVPGQFLRAEPTRDIIITEPEQQQLDDGFREYLVPEVVAASQEGFDRPRPAAGFRRSREDSPFRRLFRGSRGPPPSRFSSRRPASERVVFGPQPEVVGPSRFSPAAFSPAGFSPDVFSPAGFPPAGFSPGPLRGPRVPAGTLLDAVPPAVFDRPASVRAPAFFRDAVVPATSFGRRLQDEPAFLRTASRFSSSPFLRLLDPKVRLTSPAQGYYDNKRQFLFDLMTEVVKFCKCRQTLAAMRYLWGDLQEGKLDQVLEQSVEEERSQLLDDLGFRGDVAFDNFREIVSGTLPPPRNVEDFKDQFLRGMLDSVCRSARSYVSDVQNYVDVSLSVAPVRK